MHAGMDDHSFQDDASSLVTCELLDQLVHDGICKNTPAVMTLT